MRLPADRLPTPMVVEYDAGNNRVCKLFADAYEARRYYAAKYREGRNPKVKAATTKEPPMSETATATPVVATTEAKAPKTKAAKPVKATKAAKPVAAAKAETTEAKAPRPRKEGLRTAQVKVLSILAKAKGSLSRSEICEIDTSLNGQMDSIGRVDPELRKATDEKLGWKCLLTLGYVNVKDIDLDGKIQRGVVGITANGRKALEKHLKAEAAAK